MDISDLKIGAEASFLPPFKKGIETVKKLEETGYDSAWWADHLMGWIPESIWTPDLVNVAEYQKTPHTFFEPVSTISYAAAKTKTIQMGTSVTEVFRRHPAELAQAFLTLDHASKGRVILGIGAGEGENVIPYGIEWNKPVSRLEEALQIIRLLWENNEKVNFDGKFWNLKDAILALEPYKRNKYPPIWICAHGPRMLEITGRFGDGWFPAFSTPKSYKEGLEIIHASAKKAGRKPEKITPALWCYAILDEEHEECTQMMQSPVIKSLSLILPNNTFEEHGTTHPLGKDFYGLLDYIPTRIDRKAALEAVDKIPTGVCEDFLLHGEPDEVIGIIEEYAKIGLKHIVIQNAAMFCDVNKIKSSFKCLKKILNYFKG